MMLCILERYAKVTKYNLIDSPLFVKRTENTCLFDNEIQP